MNEEIKKEFWKHIGHPKQGTQNSQIIEDAIDFILSDVDNYCGNCGKKINQGVHIR